MRFAKAIEGFDGPPHDFVDVVEFPDALVVTLADGAGSAGDALAAVVLECVSRFAAAERTHDAVSTLASADQPDTGGESTAVTVEFRADGLRGASVGDSEAWLVRERDFVDLTEHQRRKPLLGSGEAVPVAFSHPSSEGTLVVGSDGLFKYAGPDRICEIARGPNLDAAADKLIDLVRLRNGKLQDDVAVVLCRV